MPEKHLSTPFDEELATLSSRVLEMGRLAASQVAQAVYALTQGNAEVAGDVLVREDRINEMEVEIDRDVCSIIARRQPAARDLRLLLAASKASANLERVGDEAARIARTLRRLTDAGGPGPMRFAGGDVYDASRLATQALRHAMDAFARLDTGLALSVIRDDDEIDRTFDDLLRKLVACMTEDPRTISGGIDLVFVAKAIERVGDHAKNLAEQVIYVARGTDVRHMPTDGLDTANA